jgi:serine O-acetyltransferase
MKSADTKAAPPTAAPRWDLEGVVKGLREVRERWRASQHRTVEPGGREFPSRDAMQQISDALRGALFPLRLGPAHVRQEGEDHYVGYTLDTTLNALLEQVRLELRYSARHDGLTATQVEERAVQIVRDFANALPGLRALLDTDVVAAFRGDPAARSVDEVLLCYPGILAMINHRVAHKLYELELPLLARIVAEIAHSETGIDIHPGATIGPSFFIDHGTGVVIGETAVIGERVRIYQAVTLGAKSFPNDGSGGIKKGLPRHPVVEDDVVIYAGATILGRITIGRSSVIGGNVWLTRSVPPGSQVTQAHVTEDNSQQAVPDPEPKA